MVFVFVEYRITPSEIPGYVEAWKAFFGAETAVHWTENTEAPGKFLEIWQWPDASTAEAFAASRLSPEHPASLFVNWIPGGAAKINLWTYRAVDR